MKYLFHFDEQHIIDDFLKEIHVEAITKLTFKAYFAHGCF